MRFKSLITQGIKIGNKKINFEFIHIVADAPAKAFLLKFKNHNGYFACNSFEIEGDFIDSKVCFLIYVRLYVLMNNFDPSLVPNTIRMD